MTTALILLGLFSASSAFVIPHPAFYGYRSAGIPHRVLHASAAVPHPVFHSHRSQDEFGGYHFGYAGGPSSRSELRDHVGVVRGAYNLIDADGNVQKFQYISDAGGYRLLSGNAHPEVVEVEGPAPVEEAADVKAAREAFEAAYQSALDGVVEPVAAVELVPVEDTEEVKAARAEFEAAFQRALEAATAASALEPAVEEAAAPVAESAEPAEEVAEPAAANLKAEEPAVLEAPAENSAAEEAAAEAPAEEVAAEAPVEETAAEETPVKEKAAEEAPVEIAAEEATAEEVLADESATEATA